MVRQLHAVTNSVVGNRLNDRPYHALLVLIRERKAEGTAVQITGQLDRTQHCGDGTIHVVRLDKVGLRDPQIHAGGSQLQSAQTDAQIAPPGAVQVSRPQAGLHRGKLHMTKPHCREPIQRRPRPIAQRRERRGQWEITVHTRQVSHGANVSANARIAKWPWGRPAGYDASMPHGQRTIDVQILDHPVRPIPLEPFPQPAGGECIFLGRTRKDVHPKHGELVQLSYEAYRPMAERVLRELAEQAAQQFDCPAVRLHHAVGEVPLGEASVLVQVVTGHRDQAFEACRFLIDRLKATAPIWKREIWADGATWSHGAPVVMREDG